MKKQLVYAYTLCYFAYGFSQIGGESTYQFLNLVSSPRQAALGGRVLTNVDYDVTQPLYNPATINPELNNQLAVNYSSFLGGINYGTAAYAYTIGKKAQTIHAGVTYINYGTFDGFDENGITTGTFTGSELAISLGYARQLGLSRFYLGGNLKFISSRLESFSSLGTAIDAGLLYINKETGFVATVALRNLGTQITTYAGQQEPLPFELSFGLSKTVQNLPLRWHITLENLQTWPIARVNPARGTTDLSGSFSPEEVTFLDNLTRHLIFAAELFPEGKFNLRLGYNFRRAEELRILEQRNFSGLSFGLALKLNKLRFSYTHARYSGAANTNFLGLQIDLQ